MRIIETNVIIESKGSSSNVPIMKSFGFHFADLRVLVCVVP